MHEETMILLEYDKVIDRLADFTVSDLGKKMSWGACPPTGRHRWRPGGQAGKIWLVKKMLVQGMFGQHFLAESVEAGAVDEAAQSLIGPCFFFIKLHRAVEYLQHLL